MNLHWTRTGCVAGSRVVAELPELEVLISRIGKLETSSPGGRVRCDREHDSHHHNSSGPGNGEGQSALLAVLSMPFSADRKAAFPFVMQEVESVLATFTITTTTSTTPPPVFAPESDPEQAEVDPTEEAASADRR